MKKAEFNHKAGKYFEIDGASIYYEVIEHIGKPTLLFLHGGMGNIADFNPVVPLFAEDYHIVGIDSRGHGKSTLGTEKLTYKRLQLDAEAIIHHLGLNDVHVLGYSDGGVVAYRLALSDGISVKKIVTLGAECSQSSPASNEAFFEGVTHEDYLTSDAFKSNFEFYERHNPQADIHKFIEDIEEMWFDQSENGYPNLDTATIHIPTLIVRGNDDIDTLESYVAMIPKIPNAILFNVPFEGHTPTFEKYPQFFVEVVKDFLNREGTSKAPSNLSQYNERHH
ncbi:MAG: alpha/beta hydrolase [Oscillospiraceae bacterium]|nr:alpha/beta hydrolase [Oscillospiraceae bacterium]